MNKLKYAVRKLLRLPTFHYIEGCKTPAASHLPVMMGVSRLFDIRRVLEFGSGRFSTLAFLDRSLFPAVERVDSFETDPGWYERVLELAGDDPRLNLTLVDAAMSERARTMDYKGYDLVFVDDSSVSEERRTTIGVVCSSHSPDNLVVVHDIENIDYREATSSIENRVIFDAYRPCTGVLWARDRVDGRRAGAMRRLNRALRDARGDHEPNEIDYWKGVVTAAVPRPLA